MKALAPEAAPASVKVDPGDGNAVVVRLGGRWKLGSQRPDIEQTAEELERGHARRAMLVTDDVESWDTALLTWLQGLERRCAQRGITVDRARLPEGIARLLELAAVVAEPESGHARRPTFLGRVGAATLRAGAVVVEVLGFIGRVVLALGRLVTLRARFRMSDLQQLLMQAGADAVPITTLVSVIVGLILAFVGAVQLRLFGADLYVADLVAVAMVREMGAMVVAIIMAGRTGAAYAAQLATMKVTEEIDALKTFGISTVEFLVLPRVVALFLMMPFLCLYSIALGIVGSAVVGVFLLGIAPQLYLDQTLQAVTLPDLYGGLFHGCVYGLLIGVVGCQRGLSAGNDAGAVGAATTSAVVTSLVAIVVADGVMAVVFDTLGL